MFYNAHNALIYLLLRQKYSADVFVVQPYFDSFILGFVSLFGAPVVNSRWLSFADYYLVLWVDNFV